MDSEDKQRVSLYLDKQTVKTVDVFIKKHGYRSRNEFFETAAKRRKHRRCSAAPLRFTAAGNADRKPFLRVSCAVFLG